MHVEPAGRPEEVHEIVAHLLRRAGFGARRDEIERYLEMGFEGTVRWLIDFEAVPDDVDSHIGEPGYVGVTAGRGFAPNTDIAHARQRALFRMVHTGRPLQEKMALFWHNHFATAFRKIQGVYGSTDATRMMAAKPSEDTGGMRGQYELFRKHALGNFHELLVEVARDPAMLVWLDGRLNVKGRPQENFARELLEVFTLGVGHFTEEDVYAAARVFTGWNLRRVGARTDPTRRYEFVYNAAQHDTAPKTFSFPVYPDGSRTIEARSADQGMRDGLDLLAALAAHPATGLRLAARLWTFFVSDIEEPPEAFLSHVAGTYARRPDMREVVAEVLLSDEFTNGKTLFLRYATPIEFVVRSIREVGWNGFSVGDALGGLTNMGQSLFDPPHVGGWTPGRGWFSTGGTLARMNFAARLTGRQRLQIRNAARVARSSPEALLAWTLERLTAAPFDGVPRAGLLDYVRGTEAWTGSDAQLLARAAGLFHLVLGSSEYQVV